jgi:hypothetical protein
MVADRNERFLSLLAIHRRRQNFKQRLVFDHELLAHNLHDELLHPQQNKEILRDPVNYQLLNPVGLPCCLHLIIHEFSLLVAAAESGQEGRLNLHSELLKADLQLVCEANQLLEVLSTLPLSQFWQFRLCMHKPIKKECDSLIDPPTGRVKGGPRLLELEDDALSPVSL